MEAAARGVPSSEDWLAQRIASGDLEAIGDAYDHHHTAVRRMARRLVGDEAVAEDLVHDVFVKLPSAIQGFRRDSALRTFLISIVVNHARHYVRAAIRRRSAMARFEREGTPLGPSTPEQHATRRRLASALSRALDQLPIDKRVAFVLYVVEERSSAEVAEIVGVPEATVRTRAFHARKKLREILSVEATHDAA